MAILQFLQDNSSWIVPIFSFIAGRVVAFGRNGQGKRLSASRENYQGILDLIQDQKLEMPDDLVQRARTDVEKRAAKAYAEQLTPWRRFTNVATVLAFIVILLPLVIPGFYGAEPVRQGWPSLLLGVWGVVVLSALLSAVVWMFVSVRDDVRSGRADRLVSWCKRQMEKIRRMKKRGE
ncbi:hypothetical protein [Kocuria sp. CPCC 204721]|uniref:hypothetical protein n=1 Tax=Kocuria sp. CPCC 204721 TaxID=3073548 RepID=UPI0034D60E73